MSSILYQDPWLLAINKPAGLLSVPSKDRSRDNVMYQLQQQWDSIYTVHRLDEPTSGLMLVALTLDVLRDLQKQFRQQQVQKAYIVVVSGQLAGESGDIHLPLRRDWPNRPRQTVCHAKGKPAHTHWQLLRRDQTSSRLLLTPSTGRTHQLRMHLASVNHPILGDKLYAKPSDTKVDRLFLHAATLTFEHPILHTQIQLSAPLPF